MDIYIYKYIPLEIISESRVVNNIIEEGTSI